MNADVKDKPNEINKELSQLPNLLLNLFHTPKVLKIRSKRIQFEKKYPDFMENIKKYLKLPKSELENLIKSNDPNYDAINYVINYKKADRCELFIFGYIIVMPLGVLALIVLSKI